MGGVATLVGLLMAWCQTCQGAGTEAVAPAGPEVSCIRRRLDTDPGDDRGQQLLHHRQAEQFGEERAGCRQCRTKGRQPGEQTPSRPACKSTVLEHLCAKDAGSLRCREQEALGFGGEDEPGVGGSPSAATLHPGDVVASRVGRDKAHAKEGHRSGCGMDAAHEPGQNEAEDPMEVDVVALGKQISELLQPPAVAGPCPTFGPDPADTRSQGGLKTPVASMKDAFNHLAPGLGDAIAEANAKREGDAGNGGFAARVNVGTAVESPAAGPARAYSAVSPRAHATHTGPLQVVAWPGQGSRN